MEKLYPFGVMLDELQQFGKFGLLMVTFLLPLLLTNILSEFEPREDDCDVVESNGEEQLTERFIEVFYDMERLGYI